MSIELTTEQLKSASQAPLHVTDPETNQAYVILPVERYVQLAYCDDEFDPREAYPFIDRVMAEDDANDPYLQSYQEYKKKP